MYVPLVDSLITFSLLYFFYLQTIKIKIIDRGKSVKIINTEAGDRIVGETVEIINLVLNNSDFGDIKNDTLPSYTQLLQDDRPKSEVMMTNGTSLNDNEESDYSEKRKVLK